MDPRFPSRALICKRDDYCYSLYVPVFECSCTSWGEKKEEPCLIEPYHVFTELSRPKGMLMLVI